MLTRGIKDNSEELLIMRANLGILKIVGQLYLKLHGNLSFGVIHYSSLQSITPYNPIQYLLQENIRIVHLTCSFGLVFNGMF